MRKLSRATLPRDTYCQEVSAPVGTRLQRQEITTHQHFDNFRGSRRNTGKESKIPSEGGLSAMLREISASEVPRAKKWKLTDL